MFDGAFSFRGRIGRLEFFLNGLVMMVAAMVAAIALAFLVLPVRRDVSGLVFFAICATIVLAGFMWYSLSLQVRRIRDIGWSPAVVIVAWFALDLVGPALRHVTPALLGGPAGGLAVGGSVLAGVANVGLSLALLLWPGADGTATPPASRRARADGPPPLAPRPVPARPAGFGRRV